MRVAEITKIVVPASVAFGVAWLLFSQPAPEGDGCSRRDAFKFTTTKGIEISSTAIGCKPDSLSLITAMLNSPDLREVIVEKVQAQQRFVVLQDPSWVGTLGAVLCPEYSTTVLMADKPRVARECAARTVPSQLRRLAKDQLVPFHTVSELKSMGVPKSSDRPASRRANGCKGKAGLHEKYVRVSNPDDSQRYVDVYVSGSYKCDSAGSYPDLQLNAADALEVVIGPAVPNKLTAVIIVEQDPPKR